MTTFAASPNRRQTLLYAGLCALLPNIAKAQPSASASWRALSDADWQARLDRLAYAVLRHEVTEQPFSSPLNNEHRRGLFHCAGCDLPLFRSENKFDSGTGWPSFWMALPGRVQTKPDYALSVPRTEYHCALCLGHQGHVFDDGPRPTGLRYCNNGAALRFVPAPG